MSLLLTTSYLLILIQEIDVQLHNNHGRGCPSGLTIAEKVSFQTRSDSAVTDLTKQLNAKMLDLTRGRGPCARLGGDTWDELCSSVATKFKVPKALLMRKQKTSPTKQ